MGIGLDTFRHGQELVRLNANNAMRPLITPTGVVTGQGQLVDPMPSITDGDEGMRIDSDNIQYHIYPNVQQAPQIVQQPAPQMAPAPQASVQITQTSAKRTLWDTAKHAIVLGSVGGAAATGMWWLPTAVGMAMNAMTPAAPVANTPAPPAVVLEPVAPLPPAPSQPQVPSVTIGGQRYQLNVEPDEE